LSSELKREDATARLLRRGFPYGFFSRDTLVCLYRKVSYPGFRARPAKAAYAIRWENPKNALENIVRMEPGKIATHYRRGP